MIVAALPAIIILVKSSKVATTFEDFKQFSYFSPEPGPVQLLVSLLVKENVLNNLIVMIKFLTFPPISAADYFCFTSSL
jgi:hypothetical protein